MSGVNGDKQSLLIRVLLAISSVSFQRPIATLVVCVMAAAISLGLAATRLELKMDWTALFDEDDPIVLAGAEARSHFPLTGDVAVLVDQGTPEERIAFLNRLGERLASEPEMFHLLLYRFDLKPLSEKALFYLDEKSLQQLADGLSAADQGMAPASPTGGGKKVFLKLLNDLDESMRTRGRTTYIPVWEFLAKDYQSEAAGYLSSLMDGERYVYPTIGSGDINLLAVKAGGRDSIGVKQGPMIKRLRKILDELQPTVDNLRIRLTGLPVMLNDERQTVTDDGIRSGIISMVLILIVFAIGFGEITRPLLALIALNFGLFWTMGYTTIAVGHLNFITVSLVTMLMGLGIDFGIHVIFRYDEELALGATPEEAIRITISGTGLDTFVGALATAASFMALTAAGFRGISDFGIIAAGGTLLCFFATITVLPALLALFPGKKRVSKASEEVAWLEGLLLSNARAVSAFGIVVVVAACFWVPKVGFSYNLLAVQDQEMSTVRTEIEMIRDLKTTVLSAEALDKGEAEARRKFKLYEALPAVTRVGSILPLMPELTPKKQELVTKITKSIQSVQMPDRVELETAQDLLAIEKRVKALEQRGPSSQNDPEITKAINQLRQDVTGMDPGPIQDGLTVFQKEVRDDLSETLIFLKTQKDKPPTWDDLPEEVRVRYISPDGYFRQTVQPAKNIWEKDNLEEFLAQIKTVDPGVMGHPVVQEHILQSFNRAFELTPWYTLLGVLTVIGLYLRDPRPVLLSLLPTAVGVLLIFATMGFLGVDFNVVNFVALPMSVGIGAVYGVHALHRMRELDDETLLTSSTGPALLLSGVTTVIGFASLMTAHHRGMSSLGFVISVGVAVNFVVSLFFLPALRRVFRLMGKSKKST